MDLDMLKQLYQQNAPRHDPEGFKLYRAAVEMTGFDLYGTFCYEDNRGMFEEADGHQLLRYLIAGHFHAVDWSIVPGTCYEAATLLEVDTTTPEYRAFERQMYANALARMGFQEFLPQIPSRVKTQAVSKKDWRNRTEHKKGNSR